MTALDVQQGQLILEIGMDMLKPAEFRIFRVVQML